jgi:hypothetical protein
VFYVVLVIFRLNSFRDMPLYLVILTIPRFSPLIWLFLRPGPRLACAAHHRPREPPLCLLPTYAAAGAVLLRIRTGARLSVANCGFFSSVASICSSKNGCSPHRLASDILCVGGSTLGYSLTLAASRIRTCTFVPTAGRMLQRWRSRCWQRVFRFLFFFLVFFSSLLAFPTVTKPVIRP